MTISSVRVIGATNTRHAFLARIFNPLLARNAPEAGSYTLRDALGEISVAIDKLNGTDMGGRTLRINEAQARPGPGGGGGGGGGMRGPGGGGGGGGYGNRPPRPRY